MSTYREQRMERLQKIEIRQLDVRDAKLARRTLIKLKIEDDCIAEKLGLEHMSSFLSTTSNFLIVATVENKPVGFLISYLLDRADQTSPMMLLYEIGVEETQRRQGIGSNMISMLKNICRERSVMKMWVYTNISNTAAMSLYRATGGREDVSGDEISFLYTPDSFG